MKLREWQSLKEKTAEFALFNSRFDFLFTFLCLHKEKEFFFIYKKQEVISMLTSEFMLTFRFSSIAQPKNHESGLTCLQENLKNPKHLLQNKPNI